MTQYEFDNLSVKWAEKEGWNPGLYDSYCFYKTDPNGFFIGLIGEEPISCISAVTYKNDFAFIGFYIVKPEYRGMGYGIKIWKVAMAYLQNRNIGLDGVVEQQANYMKSGFKYAYSNIRYEGTALPLADQIPDVIPLSEVPFDDIVHYDDGLFPVSRPLFLANWVNQPESMALVALQNGEIAGYSVIRKCQIGYKIGPLFADNNQIANKLFQSSVNFVKSGTKIYIDIPEVNQAAVELAGNYNLQKVFETARMYTKTQPDIDINKIYGVTSFELG